MYNTAQYLRLQDGSLINLSKRIRKNAPTLLFYLGQVKDGRGKHGKRHPLESVLFFLFCATLSGSTTIADCWVWAQSNRKWLKKQVELPHGIPHQTTISSILQVVDMESFVCGWNSFREGVFGKSKGLIASMDGKTMRGAHGNGVIRHMLSLLLQGELTVVGQIGVTEKENEIPAAKRLFEQVDISGMTIIADALHTQTETVKKIREHHADYVLIAKENQKELAHNIRTALIDPSLKKEMAIDRQDTRGRSIQTELVLTRDSLVLVYISDSGWQDVACVGSVHRTGTVIGKGETTRIDETVYFLTSRKDISAAEILDIIRKHWRIENNLHWQKDITFWEDHLTLRLGNGPQVMSFLRSMVISLLHLFDVSSVTRAVRDFGMNTADHRRFLVDAGVV